jgi:hypothetical protein
MEWVAYAVIMLVSIAVSYYAAQRANKRQDVAAGQMEQPTINQGERFRMLFGSRQIKDVKIVWTSPTGTTPIKK